MAMTGVVGNSIDNVFKVLLIGDAGVGKSRYLYLYLSIYLSSSLTDDHFE